MKGQVELTVEPTCLIKIMSKLCGFDKTRLEEYIPDELVLDILDLTEKLRTEKNGDNHFLGLTDQSTPVNDGDDELPDHLKLRMLADELHANVAHVKCKLGML